LVGALLERRYRVDRLLARGGMSSVYRGLDTRLDRQVAIKIMDPRFADDRSFVERFQREARSAAQLHHPHVVAVHDQGFDTQGENGHAFLVMELVNGGTLRDLMDEQGPLDIPLVLSVAEPVLAALAAAHVAGLVHRDVKPENVLIGRGATLGAGGVVKVGDFGLVRAVASAGTTSSSVILGTVAYLSPEQVTLGTTTSRGDVYSAGILLYEMLTGQAPYVGDTALSVAYRHVNDDVPPPNLLRPEIPAALNELIVRATRRDPEARPADAGSFLSALSQVRAELGIPLVAIPVPPPPDGDGVSDVEQTLPGITAITATTPPPTGPRGTMALPRSTPLVTPQNPQHPQHPHTQHFQRPPGPPTGPNAAHQAPPPPGGGPTRQRKRVIALWVVAVLVLGGLIGTGAWILSPSGSKTVAVPSLVGMTQDAAGTTLRNLGLSPKYPAQERSNTAPSGSVLRTDPPAGGQVQPGGEVTVVLSSGKPRVPDIAQGTPPDQAEQAIKAEQLVPIRSPNSQYSPTVPVGMVLSVSPAAATLLDIGTQVTLVLSKGPEPLPPVPDVTGKTKDDAFALLKQAGFDPYDAGQEFSADVDAGSVTRTNPAANNNVDGGSNKIGVYTSNAVTVPSLVGKSVTDAKKALTDIGLQPDVKGDGDGGGDGGGGDGGGDHGFRIVYKQDPQAGTRVPKGSKVELDAFGFGG
jgi:serine/threonine-protein kinase